MKKRIALLLLAGFFGLVACSSETGESSAEAAAPIAALQINDPVLRRTYESSCMNCHGVAGTGAPISGDVQAWAPRLAKGMDTLLDHSIDGFNSMPPMGMCPQCSEDDFVALIELMAGVKGE